MYIGYEELTIDAPSCQWVETAAGQWSLSFKVLDAVWRHGDMAIGQGLNQPSHKLLSF